MPKRAETVKKAIGYLRLLHTPRVVLSHHLKNHHSLQSGPPSQKSHVLNDTRVHGVLKSLRLAGEIAAALSSPVVGVRAGPFSVTVCFSELLLDSLVLSYDILVYVVNLFEAGSIYQARR